MNLCNFSYPMFSTTKREKEILRIVELRTLNDTVFSGVCEYVGFLREEGKIGFDEMINLQSKLRLAISNDRFLDSNIRLRIGIMLPTRARNIMRRIWITKLLNYTKGADHIT